MNHKLPSLLLTGGLLLLASAAQAQVTFGMGARLGLNSSSAPFKSDIGTLATDRRLGAEAGLVFDVGFGHFAIQPALLFSQKGFTIADTYARTYGAETTTTTVNEQYRLNYLTLPLNFVYALQADGEGFQVFAGPYIGVLLGGSYQFDDNIQLKTNNVATVSYPLKSSGSVAGGDYYSTSSTDTKYYSHSRDAGVQVGLGYRMSGFLVQAGYSLGLTNLGAEYKMTTSSGTTQTQAGPSYYNRAFQLSLSYLLGLKK